MQGSGWAGDVLLWVLRDGGLKGFFGAGGNGILPACPCHSVALRVSLQCHPPVPPVEEGRGAPQCSFLAPSPQIKGCFLPGCKGEERGRSTCPEAMVTGTTTTLQIQKKGADPSCTDTHFVQGLPKDSWCCTPERIQPHSPFPPRAAALTSHNPGDIGGSRAQGVPPVPTCLQLARRPRRQLSLEVRVSPMGVPNPARPGRDRHGGRSTGAVASPTQGRMGSAGRVGNTRLRRAFGSPAWINQSQSMLGPPWGRERQWGSGSCRRRWQRDRGGIGKSDPNAIVAEGNEAPAGLGDRLLRGWRGRGRGHFSETLDLKAQMCPAHPRCAPVPFVCENQQRSHLQQPNPPMLPGRRQLCRASSGFGAPNAAPHTGAPSLPHVPAPGTQVLQQKQEQVKPCCFPGRN